MTVELVLRTAIAAPVERVFAASLDVDEHVGSMASSGERAVAGVTSGSIGLGESVTWRARHLGVVWTMTSRITELEPGVRFVDEQVRGPFAWFRHEHLFSRNGSGTDMTDHVTFRAPLGPLGRLAEVVVLRWYLRRLLASRNLYLRERLQD
ncbi:hypothetical protein GCM10027446_05550 [Angustibacter peucedani]